MASVNVRQRGWTPPVDTGNAAEGFDSDRLSENRLLASYIPQVNNKEEDTGLFHVMVPRKLCKLFLRYFHGSAVAGHSSGSKTFSKLCCIVAWSGMKTDALR